MGGSSSNALGHPRCLPIDIADVLRLQLADGVTLSCETCDFWCLTTRSQSVRFRMPVKDVTCAFTKCKDGTLSLLDLTLVSDTGDQTLSVLSQLERLWNNRCLVQILRLDGQVVSILRPTHMTPLIPKWIEADIGLHLTENLLIRRTSGTLVMELIDSGEQIEVHDERLFQLPFLLFRPVTCTSLANALKMPLSIISAFVAWLVTTGGASLHEADSPNPWSPGWRLADRLMHSRSRLGFHTDGYGATFPATLNNSEPPPLVRPSHPGRRIELAIPNSEQIIAKDSSLESVLRVRRSIRAHDERMCLSLEQLGIFLYRSLGSRNDENEDRCSRRPFPSAGGLYPLEAYLAINCCDLLAPGLYHYEPMTHVLVHIRDRSPDLTHMLEGARRAMNTTTPIHCVITLVARFARVNWKYDSIAYTLLLKEVGVIFQTMYLVATAMDLAPCALGGGSSLAFANASGLDYWTESTVGEFALGLPLRSTNASESTLYAQQTLP